MMHSKNIIAEIISPTSNPKTSIRKILRNDDIVISMPYLYTSSISSSISRFFDKKDKVLVEKYAITTSHTLLPNCFDKILQHFTFQVNRSGKFGSILLSLAKNAASPEAAHKLFKHYNTANEISTLLIKICISVVFFGYGSYCLYTKSMCVFVLFRCFQLIIFV